MTCDGQCVPADDSETACEIATVANETECSAHPECKWIPGRDCMASCSYDQWNWCRHNLSDMMNPSGSNCAEKFINVAQSCPDNMDILSRPIDLKALLENKDGGRCNGSDPSCPGHTNEPDCSRTTGCQWKTCADSFDDDTIECLNLCYPCMNQTAPPTPPATLPPSRNSIVYPYNPAEVSDFIDPDEVCCCDSPLFSNTDTLAKGKCVAVLMTNNVEVKGTPHPLPRDWTCSEVTPENQCKSQANKLGKRCAVVPGVASDSPEYCAQITSLLLNPLAAVWCGPQQHYSGPDIPSSCK